MSARVFLRYSSSTTSLPESRVALDIPRFYSRGDEDSDTIEIEGEARIESHFPLYMNDQGL